MKNAKRMVAFGLVFMMVCTLTACAATLKGTYTKKEGLIEQKFTFMEDNKVEMSAFGLEVSGDYVIEKDEITITYHLLGLNYDWTKSFEKDGSSILVDGVEFVKEN